MEKIELFENIIIKCKGNNGAMEEQLAAISQDWNLRRLWNGYSCARACESPYVTFYDHFWDKDIDLMNGFLDMAGIKEFAITDTSTGLMSELYEFQKRGWKVTGLEVIPIYRKKLVAQGQEAWETKPAIVLKKENHNP